VALSERQLAKARQELDRRDQAKRDKYAHEYAERQRVAEERFGAKMDAAYPGIDADTRYSIYVDYCDFYQ
jgi:hypothetical protein